MREIWDCIRFVFARAWNLLVDSENEWQRIASDNRNAKQTYVMPMILFICLLALFGAVLSGDSLVVILLRPLLWLIIFLLSIPFAFWVSQFSLKKIYGMEMPDDLNEQIIGYSFTGVFFTRMILALFPNFFFVRVFALFSPYMLRFAMEILLPVDNSLLKDEQKYYLYLLVNSLSIVFSPFVIEFCLEKIIFQNIVF